MPLFLFGQRQVFSNSRNDAIRADRGRRNFDVQKGQVVDESFDTLVQSLRDFPSTTTTTTI